jgi:ATP/maltotriose-dependent transcriptional regulator MalT
MARGREAFVRRQWREAYTQLSAADRAQPLEPADLERFATAAYLTGKDAEATSLWTRAHHQLVDQGKTERAAQWGFWLSLILLLNGETARCTGWLARSQRLLKHQGDNCVELGYGCVVYGLLAMRQGDLEGAADSFDKALALAERFADPDLLALALLSLGQSLIMSGKIADGVARLDEAMVAATEGEVSPVLTGIIYCAVILTCQRIFDLRRAREWTTQFDAWCASQPDLVPYRGQCLVHRSEVLQSKGDWPQALSEVSKARDLLAKGAGAVAGRACYQQGELHRLRGEFAQADEMYRQAAHHGCDPQPGLSLLRLAEGKVDAAAAAILNAANLPDSPQEAGKGSRRPELLAPCVEVLIAAGDLGAAGAAADELARTASRIEAPLLLAASAQASGAVSLAQGKPKAALALLHEALMIRQELEMPHETARLRILLGRACRQLGDLDTARMHFDAAASVFRQLGAAPDLAAFESLMADRAGGPIGTLTEREREVLALVAAGDSNRQMAVALGISEHTVARHLSNIFDKLGVSSRTAASALAHKYNLV